MRARSSRSLFSMWTTPTSLDALVSVGRDTETQALARAVRLHIDQRVFLDGNKTVIFR